MANYYLEVSTVSRGAGGSPLAMSSYQAGALGSPIRCNRTGIRHHDSRKGDVEVTFVLAPAKCEWALNREHLWNTAEQAERRRDAKTARIFKMAIPCELDAQGRYDLVYGFFQELVEKLGVAVEVAIHLPPKDGDARNYHAHAVVTTRVVTPDGMGRKTRSLDVPRLSGVEIEAIRASWARRINEVLENAGFDARVTHLSHKRQNSGLRPERHMGQSATALERKHGKPTDRGDENRAARSANAELLAARAESVRLDAELLRARRKHASEQRLARRRRLLIGVSADAEEPFAAAIRSDSLKSHMFRSPQMDEPDRRSQSASRLARGREELSLRQEASERERRAQLADEDALGLAALAAAADAEQARADAKRERLALDASDRERARKSKRAFARRARTPDLEEAEILVDRALKHLPRGADHPTEATRFLTRDFEQPGNSARAMRAGPVNELAGLFDKHHIWPTWLPDQPGWHYLVGASPSQISYFIWKSRNRVEVARCLRLLRAASRASRAASVEQQQAAPSHLVPTLTKTGGSRQSKQQVLERLSHRELVEGFKVTYPGATNPQTRLVPSSFVTDVPDRLVQDSLVTPAVAAGKPSQMVQTLKPSAASASTSKFIISRTQTPVKTAAHNSSGAAWSTSSNDVPVELDQNSLLPGNAIAAAKRSESTQMPTPSAAITFTSKTSETQKPNKSAMHDPFGVGRTVSTTDANDDAMQHFLSSLALAAAERSKATQVPNAAVVPPSTFTISNSGKSKTNKAKSAASKKESETAARSEIIPDPMHPIAEFSGVTASHAQPPALSKSDATPIEPRPALPLQQTVEKAAPTKVPKKKSTNVSKGWEVE